VLADERVRDLAALHKGDLADLRFGFLMAALLGVAFVSAARAVFSPS
jgi:hypothetical protein